MTELTREQARSIARVLYAVHQRRAARLAAEQGQSSKTEFSKGSATAKGDARG